MTRTKIGTEMKQHRRIQAATAGDCYRCPFGKNNARQNRFKRAFEYLFGAANSGLIQRR